MSFWKTLFGGTSPKPPVSMPHAPLPWHSANTSPFAFFVEKPFRSLSALTGQVTHGTVRVGDEAFLFRGGVVIGAVHIARIKMFRDTIDEASAGLFVGLEVKSPRQLDVHEGDIVQSSASDPLYDPSAPKCRAELPLGAQCYCTRAPSSLFCERHAPSQPDYESERADADLNPQGGIATRPTKEGNNMKFTEMVNQIQRIEGDDAPAYVDPSLVTCGFICFPSQMSKLVTEELGHQALQTNKTELWKQVRREKSVPMHLIMSNRDHGPGDALAGLDSLGKYEGQSIGMDNMQLSPDGGRTLVTIYVGFTYKSSEQKFLLAAPQMILPTK
jgi:hypothetical protein